MLAETFVDPEGYKGTCYHAAGWTKLGQTKGYARVSAPQYYQDNERPKHLWVKPLAKDALERLRDPSRLLAGEDPKARAPGVLPVSAKKAERLYRALRKVKDPRARRGRQSHCEQPGDHRLARRCRRRQPRRPGRSQRQWPGTKTDQAVDQNPARGRP